MLSKFVFWFHFCAIFGFASVVLKHGQDDAWIRTFFWPLVLGLSLATVGMLHAMWCIEKDAETPSPSTNG